MNAQKKYKQYFTPQLLADIMVNSVPSSAILSVVDLSMGECDLLDAAKKRWINASFFGADIDTELCNKISLEKPFINLQNVDSLSDQINNWTEYYNITSTAKFDLAIANPPFNYYDKRVVNLSDDESIRYPIEIVFLLKYLDIIKNGGYVSIILPYGFLSLELYRSLRSKILQSCKIIRIVKIFNGCFDKINADTCLIVMQKQENSSYKINSNLSIEYLDKNYKFINKVSISWSTSCNRLDLEYNYLKSRVNQYVITKNFNVGLLSAFIKTAKRGRTLSNKTHLMVSSQIRRFLHTTDVKLLFVSNENNVYVCEQSEYFNGKEVQEYDILISRVGSACIGKVAIIHKIAGAVTSDCLISLTTVGIDPYYLTLFLSSTFGQSQLKGIAKGSCSKYLTLKDLMQISVIIPEDILQSQLREKYVRILTSNESEEKKEKLFKMLIVEVDNILS